MECFKYLCLVSTSNHMLGRSIWINCTSLFLKTLKLPGENEGNFKIFKNDEIDLSQKSPEPNM